MSGTLSTLPPDPCGVVTGSIITTPGIGLFDPAVERTRATWTSGDFGKIAVGFAAGAAAFVDRLALRAGESVLDVASGTGNLSIPAARRGARVTGVDIAPNLVEAARALAAEASLQIRFEVGLAEALPYPDESFDTVVSMFGVMFSPRPERALSELVRVTRPGGRIALASWTPAGFVGSMLRAHASLAPPPPGTRSPLAWGDETALRRSLEPHRSRVRGIRVEPRTIALEYPLKPGGVVELFRECYGPSVRTFGALGADGRAALSAELLRLWETHNTAPHGSTSVNAEYLEARLAL